jgi:uncharacterized membrane protein (DUF485 family)
MALLVIGCIVGGFVLTGIIIIAAVFDKCDMDEATKSRIYKLLLVY